MNLTIPSRKYLAVTGSVTISIAMLSGCSLGIGSENYGCSGLPQGVQCKSTREVYMNRHNFSIMPPENDTGTPAETAKNQVSSQKDPLHKLKSSGEDNINRRIRDRPDTTLYSGSREEPAVIHTRDDIMITFINPYEDDEGSLHGRQVIYTNLHNGSWGLSYGGEKKSLVTGNSGAVLPGSAPAKEKHAPYLPEKPSSGKKDRNG